MSISSDTPKSNPTALNEEASVEDATKRDLLYLTAASMGVMAAGSIAWPLIDQMNPAADTLALSTVEVDLSPIEEGQSITVVWRGMPVFIRRRTQAEIAEARAVDVSTLRDKQTDEDRVKKPEWLIMTGLCTHLGCIPLGQKQGDQKGEYGGWFCPCHGSHYDISGRIRRGPAPKNLVVPPHEYLNDTTLKIGHEA